MDSLQNISIDLSRIQIPLHELDSQAQNLQDYVAFLRSLLSDFSYSTNEASLAVPFDNTHHMQVLNVLKSIDTKKIKYLFIVGIGGSNLGTQAVFNAVKNPLYEIRNIPDYNPKAIFLDTVSAKTLRSIEHMCYVDQTIASADEVLINVITKSGNTTETIANYEVLISTFEKYIPNIRERVIFTTNEDSLLDQPSYNVLHIPKLVGGRYSVFSTVGLFPLSLLGIDVFKLLAGAKAAATQSTLNTSNTNWALMNAVAIYIHNQKGISMYNQFFFYPELEYVGKWYRQLMGESVGKLRDIDGNTIRAGITPLVSLGSVDLHSMAQLYWGGPKDKLTNLIFTKQHMYDEVSVPSEAAITPFVEGIYGKRVESIMDAIYGGVKAAYQKNELPYIETLLPEINEYWLGYYMQMKMIEMMYLAKLMNLNAFDQPSVEDYKNETRRILTT